MNSLPLYHSLNEIVKALPLACKIKRVLQAFTLGVVATQSCRLGSIALALRPLGQAASQYRRLQRFLANPRVEIATLQDAWIQQVLTSLKLSELRLLVDETKLSDHLSVMVVGVAVKDGCIPVVWRCYSPEQYPVEGQVQLIAALVARVLCHCPDQRFWLLADRGIGTSPALIRAVEGLGVRVFFRVQGTTRFRDAQGKETSLKNRAAPAQEWQSYGDVFKKNGWLRLHVATVWEAGYAQPWCLVSSTAIDPRAYGQRFQQEVGFRDLKSDGFGWHLSHIWQPDHAERLLLVLTVAYFLVYSLGVRLPRPTRGRGSRLSVFRRGLDAIRDLTHPSILPLLPHPPPVTLHVSCSEPAWRGAGGEVTLHSADARAERPGEGRSPSGHPSPLGSLHDTCNVTGGG